MALSNEDQRTIVRNTRASRREAVADFATALGFEPDQVRSITIIDGSIRVNLFVPREGNEDIQLVDNSGDRIQKPVYEVNLLMGTRDLDEDEAVDAFVGGLEAKTVGAFGQPVEG